MNFKIVNKARKIDSSNTTKLTTDRVEGLIFLRQNYNKL